MGTSELQAGGERPSVPVMYFSFVLSGLGTALLGPILPLLTRQWQLRDEQSGTLLLFQFAGAFAGGVSVGGNLRRGLLVGAAAAALGFGIFALAPGLAVACPALLLGGFGLGRIITATNILAGRRFAEGTRASALALLNFFWSLGAMLSPLLAGILAPHHAVRTMLGGYAGLLLLAFALLASELRGHTGDAPGADANEVTATTNGLPATLFAFFGGMLLLYGGVETCMSGWLTTYALRYGNRTLVVSEYTTLLLWISLTAGRIGSSALLLRMRERTLLRLSLALVLGLTAVLSRAHDASTIAIATALLGLCLSPFFPVVFTLLMGTGPTARQAGVVIAVSGLGAAGLPWLMGVVSTRTGSLQTALSVPLAGTLLLLAMSLAPMRRGGQRDALSAGTGAG